MSGPNFDTPYNFFLRIGPSAGRATKLSFGHEHYVQLIVLSPSPGPWSVDDAIRIPLPNLGGADAHSVSSISRLHSRSPMLLGLSDRLLRSYGDAFRRPFPVFHQVVVQDIGMRFPPVRHQFHRKVGRVHPQNNLEFGTNQILSVPRRFCLEKGLAFF